MKTKYRATFVTLKGRKFYRVCTRSKLSMLRYIVKTMWNKHVICVRVKHDIIAWRPIPKYKE